MLNGVSIDTLCFDIPAPEQLLDVQHDVRKHRAQGTALFEWYLRIDALSLCIAWGHGRLWIGKNHDRLPAHICSYPTVLFE